MGLIHNPTEYFEMQTPISEETPKVSIVVPTYGRPWNMVKACLESLKSQNYPKCEIILVNGNNFSFQKECDALKIVLMKCFKTRKK